MPTTEKQIHRYIVVHEDGRIETPSFEEPLFRRPVENAYLESIGHLNGTHRIENNVVIFWSDEGSMNGMKRNAPVSNYLGFTVYGPCMFARATQKSDGLKPDQFDAILSGLQNAKEPDPADIENMIRQSLSMMEPIGRNEWAKLELPVFKQNVDVTQLMYGFIRQIPNQKKRKEYVTRLNAVRAEMREGCNLRTDMKITIAWANEEV